MFTVMDNFITQYNGKTGVGDTSGNKGQCVGLVEVYFDTLGLPHIWGNACDMPNNADRGSFDVVNNSSTYVPPVGSAVVYPAGWGGSSVGHIALVAPGTTVNKLKVFEQNNKIGGGNGACRLYEFSYEYGLTANQIKDGWPKFIVPKKEVQVASNDELQKFWHGPRVEDLDGERLDLSVDGLITLYRGKRDALNAANSKIDELTKGNATLNGQLSNFKGEVNKLQAQVETLTKDNASLTEKLNYANQTVAVNMKEVGVLNAKISDLQNQLAEATKTKPAGKEAGKLLGRLGALGAMSMPVATGVAAVLNAVGLHIDPAGLVGAWATVTGLLTALDKWVHDNPNIDAKGIVGF